MTETLISARGICWQRQHRQILHNTSLNVFAGEIVTLIGPNGAGKSTLIKILLGLIKPDKGSVVRNENLRLGYMPQKLALETSMPITVQHFLTLSKGDADWLSHCIELTGIQSLPQQAMQSLSGGELQRVLLARALYRRPNLLVLDEPVQGVDVSGQSAMYRLIKKIHRELSCSVLMVSHDLHLVMASTDRVICLNNHVCCEGHPDSVSAHPEFLRLFGERADSEMAIYTHEHDHQHDLFGNDACQGHSHSGHHHD